MTTTTDSKISYLRTGRQKRASGLIVSSHPVYGSEGGPCYIVKPDRPDWKRVIVSRDEIDAGREKPAYQPRVKREDGEKNPRKARKAKVPAVPRWKQLVARVRTYEIDHGPTGWPAISMGMVSSLADELEAAHAKLSQFLPI